MCILVTGGQGFIGKNLIVHLNEHKYTILTFNRGDDVEQLKKIVKQADAIVHLAGENRPEDVTAFEVVNIDLTKLLCDTIHSTGRKIPLLLASSIQADRDNLYGKSKLAAERIVQSFADKTKNPVYIYRLPNVFGKWCKPNYNSVVATFCHNIARNLPIQINDGATLLRLVYIDDVVAEFIRVIEQKPEGVSWPKVKPEYTITLEELSKQINAFKACRESLITELVGVGLVRALYSTYISYLNTTQFSYPLPSYKDERGVFVEMLKTKDSGQFSFFTALPGVTRGEHYHHSKTEKFLVIKGHARFGFRHLITNERIEIFTSGDDPHIVDTIPGWTHNITNVGDDEMVVMLWANEIFDRDRPDTVTCKV